MVNREIAKLFTQIADLLEVKGEDRFRVNSYRRVARTLADLTDDLVGLSQRGELLKIGESLVAYHGERQAASARMIL